MVMILRRHHNERIFGKGNLDIQEYHSKKVRKNETMKKSTGWLSLLILLAVMAGFGYILYAGIDDRGSGAFKNTKLGLDLAGGVSITYEVVGDGEISAEDLSDTIYKLRKRIDKYSTEAQVYKEGENRISIEIPGVTNAEEVLAELGSPGALYFIRAVGTDGTENYQRLITNSGAQVYKETDDGFIYGNDGISAYLYDEATNDVAYDASGNPVSYEIENRNSVKPVYVLTKSLEEIIADGSAILSGTDVSSSTAKSYTDEFNTTQHIVSLKFTDEGAAIFATETAKAAPLSGIPGTIGIYYDGELISVPNVENAITGGQAQITGMGSYEEADRLAQSIRIGGLKLELQELRSNVVGAQLGTDAINTSIKAGLIGLVIVMIFMIAVYFIPGLASSIALLLYVMMTLICINFLDITLTLPGIAGIILSIGMAVDANVIIFARMREELAMGTTVENAIKNGFSKALSAILDGNITTLIAAVVLIVMGTGSIKGFAYTLALGIVLSMITALFITKLIINALYAIGVKNPKWYGVGKTTKQLDFLKHRKAYLGISGGIIAVGIIAMVVFGVRTGDALNFSLEFKGGTATTVGFDTQMSREEIDNNLVPEIEKITGDANVQWTTVNNSNQVIFKTRDLTGEEREEFTELVATKYGVTTENITTESISSTISNEMQKDAIIAVLISAVCMLLYIWLRFSDFRFGASAVIALLHDVLVVLTFYAVIRLSVGSTFIACMLTIVGYSINATIVIFDRIRENLKAMKNKDTLEDVVNKSVSQTLTRSLFTSLTTFIMVLVLYILGVSSIKEFALPLMIGIVSGTYSSICLTGSMWNFFRKKFPKSEEDDD